MGLRKILDKAMGVPTVEEDVRPSRLLPALVPSYNEGRVGHPDSLRNIFSAFKECPAVFTAVERIGKSIGDIPLVLIEMENDPTKNKYRNARDFYNASQSKTYAGIVDKWASIEGGKVIRRHELLDVLESPCPSSQLTGHMLKAAISNYMELTGSAYVEKLFSKDDPAKLVGLWPLINPLKMFVVAGKERLIDGYVWVGPHGIVVFPPEDMIYLRSFNPESPFYGYSPTQVLRVIIAGDMKAINWNYVFFTNNARPEGILSSDQHLNDSDVSQILDTWDDSHQGIENAHRPAVMGAGMKWQDIGSKHKDMDFPNLRRYSKEEILGAYGVPPIVAGDYKDANRASSEIMYRLYYENGILPRCDLIEDMLNLSLLKKGSGLRLAFDLGAIEALKGDLLTLAKVGARARTQGWSNNELRVLLWNLPPVTDNENANAIWDPKGDEIIGHAPMPSEAMGGNQLPGGDE